MAKHASLEYFILFPTVETYPTVLWSVDGQLQLSQKTEAILIPSELAEIKRTYTNKLVQIALYSF